METNKHEFPYSFYTRLEAAAIVLCMLGIGAALACMVVL